MEELNEDGSNYLHLIVDYDYESPRSFSCYMKAIKQLDKHCNINAQNSNGKTPLRVAVDEKNDNAVKALLACGADVDIKVADGQIPLESAGYDSRRLLLEHYDKMKVARVYTNTKEENLFHNRSSRELNLEFYDRINFMFYRQEYIDMMSSTLPGYPDSLADLLSTSASSIEPGKLRALKKLCESNYLDTKFPHLGCLLRMQYRRAKVDWNIAGDSLDESGLRNLATIASRQIQEAKEEEEEKEIEDERLSISTGMRRSKTCQII